MYCMEDSEEKETYIICINYFTYYTHNVFAYQTFHMRNTSTFFFFPWKTIYRSKVLVHIYFQPIHRQLKITSIYDYFQSSSCCFGVCLAILKCMLVWMAVALHMPVWLVYHAMPQTLAWMGGGARIQHEQVSMTEIRNKKLIFHLNPSFNSTMTYLHDSCIMS